MVISEATSAPDARAKRNKDWELTFMIPSKRVTRKNIGGNGEKKVRKDTSRKIF
jgi:hypothetical protein